MNFTESLKAEIANLEAELKADPRYVKLREAQRLLSLYLEGVSPSDSAETPTSWNVVHSGQRPRRQPSSGISADVLAAAAETIRGKTEPTPTRDIMLALGQIGVQVGGANPQNVVSSLLSKSDNFISHGRSGWTLKENGSDGHATNKAPDAEPGEVTSRGLDLKPEAQGREAGPGGGA